MLSRFDDYPIHQTPEPIAHPVSADRNVYDRYWLNGFARDGEFYFGVAMAVYPNRRIQDAGFSIVRGGRQHSLHASGLAPADRGDTRVGPMAIEIVEPMKVLRVRIAPNETGIACDLVFRGRTANVQEGRQRLEQDGRTIMDSTRFTQFGTWEGWVEFGGERLEVKPARVLGTKDRSWGVRPVGEPEGGAPPTRMPQIFFVWAPIHFDDCCTHVNVFEHADGRRWHAEGMILPTYPSVDALPGIEDPRVRHMRDVGHRIRWRTGTRWAAAAELELVPPSGETQVVALEPVLRFHMLGIGYNHPVWGHGLYKGGDALVGETWNVDDLDPLAIMHLHVQQVCRARMGSREGVGVLEQIVIGPHAPSGFTEFLDGAR
jgi:hypothetical protein